MKILLTGKNGQVGFELNKKLSSLGEIIAIDREVLDLSNSDAIRHFIDQIRPDIIINPAAYTSVDKAESESNIAFQINSIAPQILAEKAEELNIPLIHFSTDYVFDGFKKEAYIETDQTNPLSVYGKTKCEGEERVRNYCKHIILRTSWVFGSHGKNFLKTIFRLLQEKDTINVISDQYGSPTSASLLSDVTLNIVNKIFINKDFDDFGTYHITCDGSINWHQYAIFLAQEAVNLGLILRCGLNQIYPISSIDYPTTASRPLNSKLNCEKLKQTFMLELPHWQDEVKRTLKEIIKINERY